MDSIDLVGSRPTLKARLSSTSTSERPVGVPCCFIRLTAADALLEGCDRLRSRWIDLELHAASAVFTSTPAVSISALAALTFIPFFLQFLMGIPFVSFSFRCRRRGRARSGTQPLRS